MKVAFISNFFNHHQKPFSDAMQTKCMYHFVSTAEMPQERILLGYKEDLTCPYVLDLTDRAADKAAVSAIIDEADAVIIGSAPESLIQHRLSASKPVFRYSERPLKNGFSIWKYPLRYYRYHKQNPKGKPIYMLCSSAFTAADYARFGLFKNRAFKWGYFPACQSYDLQSLFLQKDPTEILWCGRFLDWKHPMDALSVAKQLRSDGISFHMNLIGTGSEEAVLRQFIAENDLSAQVTLLGAMPPEAVRRHMERAGIYLFTSDRKEGWGAVLNEAMNSGCAVVASHAIGAVPFLLQSGKNGFVYKSGDVGELYRKVRGLLEDAEAQKRLGRAAYKTITEEWNAEVAAERLLHLIKHIAKQERCYNLYTSGPCSPAGIVRDDWYPQKSSLTEKK